MLRVVAIFLALALVLPLVIGTIVVIVQTFQSDSDSASLSKVNEREAIPPFGSARFTVGSSTATKYALVASTRAAHQQGMQNRSDLGGYDAMIFAFAADQTVSFINHFVPIDLDIGWYDARGVLVDFTRMDKCPDGVDCPTYSAKGPFRYAVETPAGGLSALGLTASGATLHVVGGGG